ncbi:WSC domain-containing protein [Massariosphaeria phaeospora]|uniref:WSC domain-containing protein n=1 Tax=Massariosphaeria phaeospora TaxID=100035 RepID=A0A7C8MP09_9PLEO|nr:WSC domain-containing protein [Massariosphaeria phaeospora]
MYATTIVTLLAAICAAPLASAVDLFDEPPCPYAFTPFKYSGCYTDYLDFGGLRALKYLSSIPGASVSIETCTASCKGAGYRYAGLEYGRECYCGSYFLSDIAAETSCDLPCTGNSSEICGGLDRLSIYIDPTFPGSSVANSIDYKSIGCWTEGNGGRAMARNGRETWAADIDMTVDSCLNECGARGYPFAGLEFANDVSASDCNMPCKGNSSQSCGGPDRLSAYRANILLSTEPCGAQLGYPSPSPSSTKTTQSSAPASSAPAGSKSSTSTSATLAVVPTPSNTYVAPSYTPTQSAVVPPAPTASCHCSTPVPWAGNKAVGQVPLPCVGCNDVASQRTSLPYKLYNQKDFTRCKTYSAAGLRNGCADACKTQYDWCNQKAEVCRQNPKTAGCGTWNIFTSYFTMKTNCVTQWSDCTKVNAWVTDKGYCGKPQNANPYVSDTWFSWLNSWLSGWGF